MFTLGPSHMAPSPGCVRDPYYNGPTNDPHWANVVLMLHCDGANGGTTFTDSSPSGRTVTASGGAVTSTGQSKFGLASAFAPATGSPDILISSNSDLLYSGVFTIEFWIYFVAAPASTGYFLGDPANNTFMFTAAAYTGGTKARVSFTYIDGQQSTDISPGVWVHIALSQNATTRYFFQDGVLIQSSAYLANDTGPHSFGVFNGSIYTAPFILRNAYLDDIRFTKGVCRYTGNFVLPKAAFPNAQEPLYDPYFSNVGALLHFESSITADNNPSRTNVIYTSTAAPTRDSTNPKFGTYALDVSGIIDKNICVTGSNFRASSTESITIEFWYYPISPGTVGATSAAALRSAIMACCSSYPVTAANVGLYLWYSSAGGGRIYYSNSGLFGAALPNTWHHIAIVIDSTQSNAFSLYIDGALALQTTNPAVNFSAVYFGNMGYGGSLSDGSWASYCSVGRYDDIRITSSIARYTGAFSVLNASFPDAAGTNTLARTVLSLHGETLVDSSSQPKTLALGGTATVGSGPAKFGSGALQVANTGAATANGLTVTSNQDFQFGSGDWTVEAWGYLSAAGDGGFYLFNVDSFDFHTGVTTGLPTVVWNSSGGTQVSTGGTAFPKNAWKHLVFQRRGTNFEWYLDGALQATLAITGGAGSTCNYTGNWNIGRAGAASAQNWAGAIDEFRITKGVARYTGTFTPPSRKNCDHA